MNPYLYRPYNTFLGDNQVILVAWLNENGSRTPDFYEKAIKSYRDLPIDRRLIAELFIDELFTENEICRLRQYLASFSKSTGFTMKKLSLPVSCRKSRNSLRIRELKNPLGTLTFRHETKGIAMPPPFPLKPIIIDIIKKTDARRR